VHYCWVWEDLSVGGFAGIASNERPGDWIKPGLARRLPQKALITRRFGIRAGYPILLKSAVMAVRAVDLFGRAGLPHLIEELPEVVQAVGLWF
jgi:hypothetical protein